MKFFSTWEMLLFTEIYLKIEIIKSKINNALKALEKYFFNIRRSKEDLLSFNIETTLSGICQMYPIKVCKFRNAFSQENENSTNWMQKCFFVPTLDNRMQSWNSLPEKAAFQFNENSRNLIGESIRTKFHKNFA